MLREIDSETAEKLHENNLNRIIRALEVYKTTGKTMSEQQRLSRLAPSPYEPCMIQLDYDRETLYDRINRRNFWKSVFAPGARTVLSYPAAFSVRHAVGNAVFALDKLFYI